jgi:hypothetical protein
MHEGGPVLTVIICCAGAHPIKPTNTIPHHNFLIKIPLSNIRLIKQRKAYVTVIKEILEPPI